MPIMPTMTPDAQLLRRHLADVPDPQRYLEILGAAVEEAGDLASAIKVADAAYWQAQDDDAGKPMIKTSDLSQTTPNHVRRLQQRLRMSLAQVASARKLAVKLGRQRLAAERRGLEARLERLRKAGRVPKKAVEKAAQKLRATRLSLSTDGRLLRCDALTTIVVLEEESGLRPMPGEKVVRLSLNTPPRPAHISGPLSEEQVERIAKAKYGS